MKKLLALLMALCMILSLTACARIEAQKGLSEAEDKLEDVLNEDADIEDITDAMDDYTDKAESAGATTDMNAQDIVDLLLNDASFKSQLDSVKAQGLTCELEARDNSIAYVYQYTVDVGDNATVKAALDAGKSSLQSLADSLCKIYTGIDSVIFEYRANDGSVIVTYEF